MQPFHDDTEQHPEDLEVLFGVIAAQLPPQRPSAQRDAEIAAGILRRARQSALDHRGFLTVRREGHTYATLSPGARSHTLREGRGIRIDLLQLAPGAVVPWPNGVFAQEILVISGTLNDGLADTVGLHALCVRWKANQAFYAGASGANLYVRQLLAPQELPDIEQAWWNSQQPAQAAQWESLSEGVEIKALRQVGEVMSTLARIAPGAHVLDHGHVLDEDCLMLKGDLFLGDILLRENDYQVAPAGCNHLNSMSDTGALFYFHGHMPIAI